MQKLSDAQACHIKYQATDGQMNKARSWCPESIEEIQEVYREVVVKCLKVRERLVSGRNLVPHTLRLLWG